LAIEKAKKALKTFLAHFKIIKKYFGESKNVRENDKWKVVPELLIKTLTWIANKSFSSSTCKAIARRLLCKIEERILSQDCLRTMFVVESKNLFNPMYTSHMMYHFFDFTFQYASKLDVSTFQLCHRFEYYMKLVEIAIVLVLGNVEDERTFSSKYLFKPKTRNSLLKNHLEVVVGMYSQKICALRNFLVIRPLKNGTTHQTVPYTKQLYSLAIVSES
jgi:hypothetical protein